MKKVILLCGLLVFCAGCESFNDRMALTKEVARQGLPTLGKNILRDPTPVGIVSSVAEYALPIIVTLVSGGAAGTAAVVRHKRKKKAKKDGQQPNPEVNK